MICHAEVTCNLKACYYGCSMPKFTLIPHTNAIYPSNRLENHRMWPVGRAKAEACAEIVNEMSLLLEGGEKGLVDGLLVGNAVF